MKANAGDMVWSTKDALTNDGLPRPLKLARPVEPGEAFLYVEGARDHLLVDIEVFESEREAAAFVHERLKAMRESIRNQLEYVEQMLINTQPG